MIAEAARVADEGDETTMREGDVRASCRCMYSRRSRVESVGLSGNSDRDYTTGGTHVHACLYTAVRIYIFAAVGLSRVWAIFLHSPPRWDAADGARSLFLSFSFYMGFLKVVPSILRRRRKSAVHVFTFERRLPESSRDFSRVTFLHVWCIYATPYSLSQYFTRNELARASEKMLACCIRESAGEYGDRESAFSKPIFVKAELS